jgi:hypothetical protein
MAAPYLLRTFTNRLEADMAHGLLESAGVRSWLVTDGAGDANPFQLSGVAHLMVDEADRAAAEQLLERAPDG